MVHMIIHTEFEFWSDGKNSSIRFCRFFSISLFRANFSESERINDFFIPTRKHFANRQQLHKRRVECVIEQCPSP